MNLSHCSIRLAASTYNNILGRQTVHETHQCHRRGSTRPLDRLWLKGVPQLCALRADIYLHSELRRRSEEHTSELQSRPHLVCRLLLEKKKKKNLKVIIQTIISN